MISHPSRDVGVVRRGCSRGPQAEQQQWGRGDGAGALLRAQSTEARSGGPSPWPRAPSAPPPDQIEVPTGGSLGSRTPVGTPICVVLTPRPQRGRLGSLSTPEPVTGPATPPPRDVTLTPCKLVKLPGPWFPPPVVDGKLLWGLSEVVPWVLTRPGLRAWLRLVQSGQRPGRWAWRASHFPCHRKVGGDSRIKSRVRVNTG